MYSKFITCINNRSWVINTLQIAYTQLWIHAPSIRMCRGKQLSISMRGWPSGKILPEKYNSLSAPFTQRHKLSLLPESYGYYDNKLLVKWWEHQCIFSTLLSKHMVFWNTMVRKMYCIFQPIDRCYGRHVHKDVHSNSKYPRFQGLT